MQKGGRASRWWEGCGVFALIAAFSMSAYISVAVQKADCELFHSISNTMGSGNIEPVYMLRGNTIASLRIALIQRHNL